MDERKWKAAENPGKKRTKESGSKGSTGGTAVGAKPGRMKGNKQEAKYRKPKMKYGKPDGREGGRRKKRKQKTSTEEATERRRQEEKGKEETES